jgi:hypothetical protein
VYFVEPTQDNIRIIGEVNLNNLNKDLKRGLYDSIYFNFTSTLSRGLMEDLAAMAVASGAASNIVQVYDQFLNYICLDSNLFSLEIPDTFKTLHDPTTPEIQIESLVDNITAALFSVIGTIGGS